MADFPWHQLNGKPLIYASLGTIQNQQLDLFARIAEACSHLDAQLVIALGGGSNPNALPSLPGHPLVVGFAPQLALLQRAALTITHAGLNTVLESLRCGVPMVAIPIANDQPGVAARVAWSRSSAPRCPGCDPHRSAGAVALVHGCGMEAIQSRSGLMICTPAIDRSWAKSSENSTAQRLRIAASAISASNQLNCS